MFISVVRYVCLTAPGRELATCSDKDVGIVSTDRIFCLSRQIFHDKLSKALRGKCLYIFPIAMPRLDRIMPGTFRFLSPRMATFCERGAEVLHDLNTYHVCRQFKSYTHRPSFASLSLKLPRKSAFALRRNSER